MATRADHLRVLLVDDMPLMRNAVARFIGARGGEVLVAGSAINALDVLQDHTIDVLVSEIQMARHDGFWLIREVRSMPALRSLPAIAFTSLGPEHRQRILDAGFSEHVVKDNLHGLWLAIQALRRRAAG